MKHLKLKDDYVDSDQIFGPMPNFNDSFEKFFIQKAVSSIFKSKDGGNSPKDRIEQDVATDSDDESNSELVV
jgi:hypothetical protein